MHVTTAQLEPTRQAIDAYIQSIAHHPDRREGAFPYYRFHEAGVPVRGTVLMFHGFSAKPGQLWRLADYLFNNGFNFYQVSLAGHAYRVPDVYWPQVDLKPEIRDPAKAKIQHDPILQDVLHNLKAADGSAPTLTPLQMAGLIARLNRIEPRTMDIMQAIADPNDPDFDTYYLTTHMQYLQDAKARLAELDAMPGPIYTLGLSVGGATALALAAAARDRVSKVVAYAPLLRVYGRDREKYINIAGPLDIKEFGWDSLRFPLGCFTATNRFGQFVQQPDNIRQLQELSTLTVLTENEDAADIETSEGFVDQLRQGTQAHHLYKYPSSALVPHPLVDPEEISQGMRNSYWQTLYQETFRFLTTGDFNPGQMEQIEQDPALPTVRNL